MESPQHLVLRAFCVGEKRAWVAGATLAARGGKAGAGLAAAQKKDAERHVFGINAYLHLYKFFIHRLS
jgi:hypothetical protein